MPARKSSVHASVPRHPGPQHGGRARGFTLIELLLALVVGSALLVLAFSSYASYMDQAKVSRAEADINALEERITRYQTSNGALPASLALIGEQNMLDPWGHPYQYLDFDGLKGKGQMRKDHNLVPINSDYDLYSDGKDGQSVPPLVAAPSRDDIVRANNGGFVGLASDY